MKNALRLSALLVIAAFHMTAVRTVRADDAPTGKPAEKHPVNVCIVSGEHLQPGEIVTYAYQEPGHPDRVLRFCCRKCLARFKADPDRYLKNLNQLETGENDGHRTVR